MTDPCICPPSDNRVCLTNGEGTSISQPQCQLLPSSNRVTNPYYDINNNTSFFSYGIYINCGDFPPIGEPGNIVSFLVAICNNIPLESILNVSLLLDSCSIPINLSYEFDDSFIPPDGFRFLRITVDQLITPGTSGIFQISLSGNYPPDSPPGTYFISTQTTGLSQYDGTGSGFSLPSCPNIPRLSLTKSCTPFISNNTAVLEYRVVVANTGDVNLNNVLYEDTLNYDGSNISLGEIAITPPSITADTSVPGIVRFTGNLGTIPQGSAVEVAYSVPISMFNAPGVYNFSNMATARSGLTEGSSECSLSLDVVSLNTGNCCILTQPSGAFVFSIISIPNSPNTEITLTAEISIPQGLVIQFNDFSNCIATLPGGDTVPLDSDITNTRVFLRCNSLVTADATVNFPINFTLITLNTFSNSPIEFESNLTTVSLVQPDSQILLDVSPLPNTNRIDIDGLLQCQTIL